MLLSMLFNADLFDTISEVRVFCLVPSIIAETLLYDYLEVYSTDDISDSRNAFFAEIVDDKHLLIELDNCEEAARWLLDQISHHVLVNRGYLGYCYISKFLVKLDYRDFMMHCINKKDVYVPCALLMYGTVDQVEWAFTIKTFMRRLKIQDVVYNVAKLDIMQCVYKAKPRLFIGVEVGDITDLLHCSKDVKRDIETLEYFMTILGYGSDDRDDCIPFPAHIIYLPSVFLRSMLIENDESLFEWLCVNQSLLMRHVVRMSGFSVEFLYEIATKCSHRIMLLFLNNIYEEQVYADKRFGDVVKNLHYLTEMQRKYDGR